MRYIPKYQRGEKIPTLREFNSTQDGTYVQSALNPIETQEVARQANDLRIKEKAQSLTDYYNQPNMIGGMKRKPTTADITTQATNSVAYNEQLKNNPVGTLGPDLAMSLIPEVLMLKTPQQFISKVISRVKTPQFISKSISKLNPFKNNNALPMLNIDKNAYYRVIGNNEGYLDAITSKVIRPNQTGIFKGRQTYYTKGAINDINNPVVKGGAKKGTVYAGDYVVEVKPNDIHFPKPADNLNKEWNFGSTMPGNEIPIDSEFVKLYKRTKKGYVNVDKSPIISDNISKKGINGIFANFDPRNLKTESGLDWMKKWHSHPDFVKKYNINGKYSGDAMQQYVLGELGKYQPKNYIDLLKDKGLKTYLRHSISNSGVSWGTADKIYYNRTPHLPFNKRGLESTKTHELTHLIEGNGHHLGPLEEQSLLKPFGVKDKNAIPKKGTSQREFLGYDPEYFLEPTEIHARMNEARFELGLSPKDEFTTGMFNKIAKDHDWYGMGKYIKNKEDFKTLMNTFWATTPLIGVGALVNSNNQKPQISKYQKGKVIYKKENLHIIQETLNTIKELWKK